MVDFECLEQWADYLIEHPLVLEKVCDRIYELMLEEIWNDQERSGNWPHRF
ncbi:MAG: hypothetical protein AAGD25_02860 [Cyanobacteria bacterium P01_F01_bin.150]